MAADDSQLYEPFGFAFGGVGELVGIGVEHFPDATVASARIGMSGVKPDTEEIAAEATSEFCKRFGRQVLTKLFQRNAKRYEVLLVRLQWKVEGGRTIDGALQSTKRLVFTWDYRMPGCEART